MKRLVCILVSSFLLLGLVGEGDRGGLDGFCEEDEETGFVYYYDQQHDAWYCYSVWVALQALKEEARIKKGDGDDNEED